MNNPILIFSSDAMTFNHEKFSRINIDWKASSEHIIDIADEGIAFFNPQFEVVYWNKYIEKITGKSKNDLEGKSLHDVVPSISLHELTNLLSGNAEHLNKKEENFAIKVVPSYNESNEITGGIAILKTLHKGRHQAKNKGKTDFKIIFESLPGLYLILSPEFKILDASNSYLKSTNTKKERLLNQNILEALGQNQEPKMPASLKKLRESLHYVQKKKVRNEISIQKFNLKGSKKNGPEEKYWSISNIPVLDKASRLLYIIVNIADITLEYQTQKEVETNKKKFVLLSTSANVVVWEYDFINDHLWWNQNFKKVFKHENSKHLTLQNWINNIHPDDRKRVSKSFQRAITEGKKKWMEEYRFMRGDGSYAYVQDTGYLFINKEGKPHTIIGTILDLTKSKEAEFKTKAMAENFFQKNKELRKTNEMLDTFVFAAAHDLKSPVNNLKSLVELMSRASDEGQKMIFMEAINNSVLRLDKTIKSLGEIIEIQSSKDVSIKDIEIYEIIEQVLADYETDISSSDIKIIKDCDLEENFKYNEAFIVSVLMNLISNAIKYRSKKRKTKIHIKCRKKENFVVLSVEDNGIGIDLKKHKNSIFKPFKRFTQTQEGKGIGLHLIKSIVERNGGKIEVQSELGKGTTFTVYLREYAKQRETKEDLKKDNHKP